MNSHEGAPQPNSNEFSNEEQSGIANGWESVAALANEYEDKDSVENGELVDYSVESLQGENTETETKAKEETRTDSLTEEQAPTPKLTDPRAVIRQQRQNKSIARQSAISVVESQSSLMNFRRLRLSRRSRILSHLMAFSVVVLVNRLANSRILNGSSIFYRNNGLSWTEI